jgi:hypothetical protein
VRALRDQSGARVQLSPASDYEMGSAVTKLEIEGQNEQVSRWIHTYPSMAPVSDSSLYLMDVCCL